MWQQRTAWSNPVLYLPAAASVGTVTVNVLKIKLLFKTQQITPVFNISTIQIWFYFTQEFWCDVAECVFRSLFYVVWEMSLCSTLLNICFLCSVAFEHVHVYITGTSHVTSPVCCYLSSSSTETFECMMTVLHKSWLIICKHLKDFELRASTYFSVTHHQLTTTNLKLEMID